MKNILTLISALISFSSLASDCKVKLSPLKFRGDDSYSIKVTQNILEKKGYTIVQDLENANIELSFMKHSGTYWLTDTIANYKHIDAQKFYEGSYAHVEFVGLGRFGFKHNRISHLEEFLPNSSAGVERMKEALESLPNCENL